MADEETRGTLKVGEPHPMAQDAMRWIGENYTIADLMMTMESLSSCAIENNRLAEICAETLDRILIGKPVSDRYLFGLAWYMKKVKETAEKLRLENIHLKN